MISENEIAETIADLTEAEKSEIADTLTSYADGYEQVSRAFPNIDPGFIEDIAGELNVEKCEGCDWWFACHDLNEDLLCNDCSPVDSDE